MQLESKDEGWRPQESRNGGRVTDSNWHMIELYTYRSIDGGREVDSKGCMDGGRQDAMEGGRR